jgi:hypothetical protein
MFRRESCAQKAIVHGFKALEHGSVTIGMELFIEVMHPENG